MASKNEIDKPSTNRSTKTPPTETSASTSITKKTEGDIFNTESDTNKNNNADNASTGQASGKGKKRETGKRVEDKAFKSRAMLEKELLEKSQRVDSLELQLKDLQENFGAEQAQEKTNRELFDETKAELARAQEELKNFPDLRKKNSVLSEENYSLRERLVKKDEEIARLNEAKKAEQESAKTTSCEQETPMHKILRKENVELHYEKEQLKVERDRLRQTLKEKQDQSNKMSSSIGDLEDQLFQAKRALEDRARTSSRLEDRLTKMDGELERYREEFTKLKNEQTNRDENAEDKNALENEKEINTLKHVAMLQAKEERLLRDRHELEIQVNKLTTKIKILENQLRKCSPEGRPTNERGSQTDMRSGAGITQACTLKRQPARSSANRQTTGDETAVRKCKGIIKSLGRFFEELVQNQDDPKGSTRGRRTAIAARKANELLHELSVSMEHLITPQDRECGVSDCAKSEPAECSGGGARRSGTNQERTLWDKVSHEVAHHEFAFERMSPTSNRQGAEVESDKEVERAEKGLHRLLYQSGPPAGVGKNVAKEMLTNVEASKLMEDNRKQTEIVVRQILSEHHGEIKAIVASAIPKFNLADANAAEEGGGNADAASLAVQELDTFKTRAVKVQSLILKMHALVESTKDDKESVHCQLQVLDDELKQKEALLQAKSQELRRRHCKTLEMEKSFQAQIESLTEAKTRVGNENARLQDVCRQRECQIVEKGKEVKDLRAEIAKREKAHQQNLGKMRKKAEEAWNQYNSVKTRAEKRTAEFNEAAEKLKVSQGYLLDLWQTLKTVDNVVEAENDEL